MGSIVAARCPCGIATKMALGGGINSHTAYCAFPALCSACGAFGAINLLGNAVRCPSCSRDALKTYDDPSLAGSAGEKVVFGWTLPGDDSHRRSVRLTDGTYLCPTCRQPTLTFSDEGFWD